MIVSMLMGSLLVPRGRSGRGGSIKGVGAVVLVMLITMGRRKPPASHALTTDTQPVTTGRQPAKYQCEKRIAKYAMRGRNTPSTMRSTVPWRPQRPRTSIAGQSISR